MKEFKSFLPSTPRFSKDFLPSNFPYQTLREFSCPSCVLYSLLILSPSLYQPDDMVAAPEWPKHARCPRFGSCNNCGKVWSFGGRICRSPLATHE
jgi:hypothetical protein